MIDLQAIKSEAHRCSISASVTVFPDNVDPAELIAFEIWDCTNAAKVGEDVAVVFARLKVIISRVMTSLV